MQLYLYLTDEDFRKKLQIKLTLNYKLKKMNKSFKIIPKDQRKKIMLVCDDIRVHSGVATIAKEIVISTSHHFNWINVAGAIKHPEKGKRLDISSETNKLAGIEDSSVFLYCVDGYGNSQDIMNDN